MMRFLRSQIVAGIFSLMVLLWSEIAMMVLLVHVISGQSQGEDEEFHDWSDGGLPSCCLTSRRIARSSCRFWEIIWKGKKRTRRRNRAGNEILANKNSGFDITGVSVRTLRREEDDWERDENQRFNFKLWWAIRIYLIGFYKLTSVLGLITKEPRVHDQWTGCFEYINI